MVTGRSFRDTCFWQKLCFFARLSLRALGVSAHAVKVNFILSSKGRYLGAGHTHFLSRTIRIILQFPG